MQTTVCVLASGSKGNAIFVSDGCSSILIDAGLSGAEIRRRMVQKGLDPTSVRALIVSHEHSDHVRGVGVLSRRYGLPVYVNAKTAQSVSSRMGRVKRLKHFECGRAFRIAGFRLHPFSVSHDAADPAGFAICCNGAKIGIATDLGAVTEMVRHHLRQCQLVILEANHDEKMLIEGPYPWHLKQRVKGRTGHLSNEDSGLLLESILHPGLERVVLAHLSEINNTPARALEAAAGVLHSHPAALAAAEQHRCTDVFRVREPVQGQG